MQPGDRDLDHVVPEPRGSTSLASRAPVAVFGAVEIAALAMFLVVGHFRWFVYDEWDFLVTRDGGDVHDLLRPHGEHWSTLPILVYRLLWHVVGLRSYVPYQVIVIALHLTAAALLWLVMRRAAVRPWIATVVASVFALLGSGYGDIVWAFQIGFVGSLVFGLTHLLLADHDGFDRRDVFGLLAGFAGLLCSGVAATMVVVVAIAMWLRRGYVAAAVHALPLAVALVWWEVAFGRHGSHRRSASPDAQLRFVSIGLASALDGISQVPGVAFAVVALLVIGLSLALYDARTAGSLQRLAVPAALFVGAFVFLAIAAFGRAALGTDAARASRYIHVVAAMLLPAVGVAGEAVVRRLPVLSVAVAAILLVGIPGNVQAAAHPTRLLDLEVFHRGQRDLMLALPQLPAAKAVPATTVPEPALASPVSIGWLLEGVETGRVPRTRADRRTKARATLLLLLRQERSPVGLTRCTTIGGETVARFRRGERMTIDGMLRVALPDGPADADRSLDPTRGRTVVVLAAHRFVLRPDNPTRPPRVCGGVVEPR